MAIIKANRAQLNIFYISSLILIVLDQITKVWAQQTFRGEAPLIYLGDFFRFEYAENPGAFLGMGDSLSDPLRFWIFSIFVLFLMIGLCVYLHMRLLSRQEAWAYSLIFAGGIGNLIDRMFRENGHVIDFMNMGIGSLRTGIFNVADVAIMAGLFLMILTPKAKSEKASDPIPNTEAPTNN